jgi:cytochrome c oxidase cbb3-type subunit 3
MTVQRISLRFNLLLAAVCLLTVGQASTQTTTHKPQPSKAASSAAEKTYFPELVQKGKALFQQDCSFCHGRDATGGESGPDLTRSKLVAADVKGDKIGPVVRNGRLEKGMPPFDRSDDQIAALAAFIHTQRKNAMSAAGLRGEGGRKGVDPSDLQTGNAEAGKQYFNSAGGCSNCHSPTGDLAGIASRHQGLELEELMLYPKHAKSKVEVTLASGQTMNGTLAYLDEFTVGLVDADGVYHSWRAADVHYKVDEAVNAHVDLFSKYTDDDIHNLMAYLQTLR